MNARSSVRGQATGTFAIPRSMESGKGTPSSKYRVSPPTVGVTCSSPAGTQQKVLQEPPNRCSKVQVVGWPRPAFGVVAGTPGRVRSAHGCGEACQVGGGGNSNQIRHTTCRPRGVRRGESRGKRKQERFEAGELPLTLSQPFCLVGVSGKPCPSALPGCVLLSSPGAAGTHALLSSRLGPGWLSRSELLVGWGPHECPQPALLSSRWRWAREAGARASFHLCASLQPLPPPHAGGLGERVPGCRQLPESPPTHLSALETKYSTEDTIQLQEGVKSQIALVPGTKLE